MIPLKDNIPSIRRPVMVWLLFAANLLVFLLEQALSDQELFAVSHLLGAVPARFTDPEWAEAMGYPARVWPTAFTYMFLHAGWLHFLLNMWVLWIFADNVEDALGHWRFLGFYLACGLAALALHVLFHPGADVPVIGASGAIAGVMGAYFRLFPRARVVVLVPILFIPWIVEVRAVLFLGIWFAIQVISGLAGSAAGSTGQDVAWWAHAGGFVCGMILVNLLGRLDCRYCYLPEERAYERLPRSPLDNSRRLH